MDITFYGAVGTVTGSKYLLQTIAGLHILLDCGMYQGERDIDLKRTSNELPFDATTIDYVLLSHAHIDHSGLLPLLAKLGFEGKVFATQATIDLLEMMLADSAFIQEQDLKYVNRAREQKDLEPIEPLYNIQDVNKIMDCMHAIKENEMFLLGQDVFVKAYNNGHILGSVGFHITERQKKKQVSIYFTGDIGRKNDPILKDPVPFPQADYIICESTYGDKLHPPLTDVEPLLLGVIRDICVDKKGKIVIPAFSVDRTQELIYLIDRMSHFGLLPKINVYVDSPMSTKATQIIKSHMHEFNQETLDYIAIDGDPFCFPKLKYVESVEESKAIDNDPTPGIIISASGMAEAGRVKHHIKNLIGDANNLILMVGFATPDSLAGKLRAGKSPVRIFGEEIVVKAQVMSMDYFSAHADYLEMIDYLDCQDKSFNKGVFLVHGRNTARESFKLKLEAVGYKHVHTPSLYDTFSLD
jgi:metallo-beta-lactamase family protein